MHTIASRSVAIQFNMVSHIFTLLAFLMVYSPALVINDRRSLAKLDPRVSLNNDFENGTMSPWCDQSNGQVHWKVESFDTPFDLDSPGPQPFDGSQYLRAVRNANLQSGLTILNSPSFTALPGDLVSFSFWIRSRRLQGNTLEVNFIKIFKVLDRY